MDIRYITLSSAYRNRTVDPSPFNFATYSVAGNSVNTTRQTANDWVSDSAPIVNYDIWDYFQDASTYSPGAQGYFLLTGPHTIESPTYDQDNCTAMNLAMNLPYNVDAPAYVDGTFVGCYIRYDNGSGVSFSSRITEFQIFTTDVGGGVALARVVFSPAIVFRATSTVMYIYSPRLALNQLWVPPPVNAPNLANSYAGLYVIDSFQTAVHSIVGYDRDASVVTLDSDIPFPPGAAAPTDISSVFGFAKSNLLIQYAVVSVSGSTVQVAIADHPDWSSTQLVAQYAFFPTYDLATKITNVTTAGANYILTLSISSTALSVVQANDALDVLLFTRDNWQPFEYQTSMRETQSLDRSQVPINVLDLVALQLPKQILSGFPGGYVYNYPYLFLDLDVISSNNRSDSIIYANNPHLKQARFVVELIPYSSFLIADIFVPFVSNGMSVPINIKPGDSVRLTIRSPSGDILQLADPDTTSPFAPDVMKQVTAVFSVSHMSSGNTNVCPTIPVRVTANATRRGLNGGGGCAY